MSCSLTNLNAVLPGLSSQTQKKKGKKINAQPPVKVSPLKAMGMGGDGRVPPPPAWETRPDPSPRVVWETLPDPSPPVQQMELPVGTFDDTWKVDEGEGEYRMSFDMPPGVTTRKDCKVFVEDDRLVVKADHKDKGEEGEGGDGEEEEQWWAVKNYGGGYNRRIKLPVNAEADEIKARLKDGVLYVVIPKRSPPRGLGLE